MTCRRSRRRRLGAVLGLAALVAALHAPAAPRGSVAAPVGGDRIADPPVPGTLPVGTGPAVWGSGHDGLLDGLESTTPDGRRSPPTSPAPADLKGEARNIRAARLLRAPHAHVQARLRAGSAIHATTLPPPRVPRSGRPD